MSYAAKKLVESMLSVEHSDDVVIKNFRKAFLNFASETEDNVKTAELIHFKNVRLCHGVMQRAFFVGEEIPISEILSELTGVPIPDDIAKEYPNLTQEQWCYTLHAVSVIMKALSC